MSQAIRETGLSRHELYSYMADGTLRYVVKDKKGTRLIAYSDLERLVHSLKAAEKRGTDPKKPRAEKPRKKTVIKSVRIELHSDGTARVKGMDNARLVTWCERHKKQITINVRDVESSE